MFKFIHAADLHLDSPFAALPPDRAAQRRQELRDLTDRLAELAQPGDLILTVGAGDIYRAGEKLLERT